MNKEINKETLVALYYEYKELIIPVLVIIISIVLVFVFLIPQVASFSEKRNQRNNEMTKLKELTDAANLASSADVDKLNSNLTLATAALPQDKAFEGVINTISIIAISSNVVVSGYQFQGDSSLEGGAKKIPGLLFSVDLDASPTDSMVFINSLHQAFPLSEVTSIKASEILTTVNVIFYYEPFSPFEENDRSSIRELNSEEKETLGVISKWKNPVQAPSNEQEVSPTPQQ